MKPLLFFVLLAPFLAGCNTVFGTSQNFDTFLKHMDGCDRDYQVAFGGGVPSVNGAATIHCKAQSASASQTPP